MSLKLEVYNLTESDLIKECLKNNDKAKEELYVRFEKKMFGVCMRYAKNKMEAEDILHDGYLKVLNNLHSFRGDGPLGGWIRRIMVNTALNHCRDNSHFNSSIEIENIEDDEADNNKDIVGNISANEMIKYIQELPRGYRTVFNLFAVEGYSHKEIGDMLNISENTSKTQLLMARKALQKRINKELELIDEKRIRK